MDEFADQLINILNDPTHEKHGEMKEIMATDFANNNSSKSYIQLTIKRRMEELEKIHVEKQVDNYKRMWEDRFDKLRNTNIETNPNDAVNLINDIVSEFVNLKKNKEMYSMVHWIRHEFFTDIIGWAKKKNLLNNLLKILLAMEGNMLFFLAKFMVDAPLIVIILRRLMDGISKNLKLMEVNCLWTILQLTENWINVFVYKI